MSRETILIVEDDGIIAAYLQDMLLGLGYTALEPVATGEAAIAAVQAQPPDLVLMDIKLAGEMDGITVAGHIQSAADTPIVYLTGYSQDLQLQQAKLTAPYGYLVKPATEREVAAAIEIALYKHALDRRLKESEEKYRRLVDNANEAIFVAQDGRLKFVNRMSSDLTGYSEQELTSRPFPEFIHPEDRGMVVERHLRRLQGDAVQPRSAFRLMTRDGSVKWVEVGPVLMDWEGRPATLNFLIDITERRRAEAEKEELAAQNRQLQKFESLGRMAGAIAHHFNNQLQGVMGNLEMAMEELPRAAGGPVECLIAAMESARRAAEVSRLMLTYLGQTVGECEALDLAEACQQHLPMLQASRPKDVVLEPDLPSPGPTVRANATQIQQVLTNLVTNAWEAVGDGRGAIHVTVKTVSAADIPVANRFPIGWQPHDTTYAYLEVRDTGCGIAGEDIEKIFDPFFSSKFTGRGLGLPVAMGVVRAHGGGITVASVPGRGSVLRVFLPLSVGEIPRRLDQAPQAPAIQGGGLSACRAQAGTVLLVEDEKMVRNVAARILKRMGFSVLEASDGVEAVEVFRQHSDGIRCVLCDLTMPRMNGWETLEALRRLAPGIPVVLASGYDEASVMAGDHPEWPQAFLSKPYQRAALKDALAKAMGE